MLVLPVLFVATGGTLYAEQVLATFAGGCFWCMQGPMEEIPGVIDTTVGFSGGRTINPSYEEVVSERTGHYEVIQVLYDDERVSYARLLDVFWTNIDPYDNGGQFCDRGHSYRTAIFYHDGSQRRVASSSKRRYDRIRLEGIVTPIIQFNAFYPAEEYHQDYHIKNAGRYKTYRFLCGRDARLNDLWK